MIRRTSLCTNAVALGDILDGNGDVRHAGFENHQRLKDVQATKTKHGRDNSLLILTRAQDFVVEHVKDSRLEKTVTLMGQKNACAKTREFFFWPAIFCHETRRLNVAFELIHDW
jgi:hypothetical protein